MPTLTNETTSITNTEIFNGYTLNLTKTGGDGSCTGTTNAECSVHSNKTLGVMIPPVRSARLSTKGKRGIRYGRVEVVAKMPEGDWLWPAICARFMNTKYKEFISSVKLISPRDATGPGYIRRLARFRGN